MSAVADKLREARAIIELGWTQGAFARDANGNRVFAHSPGAVCYCATGAVSAAFGPSGGNRIDMNAAFDWLAEAVGGADTDDIEEWNDEKGRTQAQVIAAFSKAIKLADLAEAEDATL